MPLYKKKPIIIEAVNYEKDNILEIQNFFGDGNGRDLIYDADKNEYYIKTLEGNMYLTEGDYIIKGVVGEFYPCKPDVFVQTYEPINTPLFTSGV